MITVCFEPSAVINQVYGVITKRLNYFWNIKMNELVQKIPCVTV